ncbi:MAG: hypothetical protein LR008_03860 [Candidatus Pacebacteria bacterium]|nr:hypothetical protein [Candidatus Paceibacterota bacterium]
MFNPAGHVGRIIVHELDNIIFRFSSKDGEVFLFGEVHHSDRKHQTVAHMLANEFNVAVVWQDICGNKHFVNPGDEMGESVSVFDPRDNHLTENVHYLWTPRT